MLFIKRDGMHFFAPVFRLQHSDKTALWTVSFSIVNFTISCYFKYFLWNTFSKLTGRFRRVYFAVFIEENMQYFFEIEMFWNKILKVRFFKYFLRSITISNLVCLCSRFLPLGSFYALWKPQKTSGLTMFSRDTERKQWHEMGWLVKLLDLKFSFWNSTFSNMSRWPWLCTSVCVFYYPTLLYFWNLKKE